MNRFERCDCGDTLAKHDDNGVCRVKDCDCLEFIPLHDSQIWGGEVVRTVLLASEVA